MATNLQVNAQTSQAVGAFNQLAQAIASARGQFQQLTTAINNSNAAGDRLGSRMLRNVDSAFNILSKSIGTLLNSFSMLGAGIEYIFSSILRELDKLQGFNAIMSVTTKSTGEAANAYDFLRKTADRLGIQFDSLTSNYAKLVASLPEGNDKLKTAEKTFLGIAMAARTLHSSNQDVQLMFYAVTQIASKGVVSMEELRRQLGEKLPGALNIAARAFNTTPELLEAAIRKGAVNSQKFLAGFSDELIRTFGDSSKKASESLSAAVNRLTNVWVDFVKEILDSGAGQAIVNVFDALREKLSDPYLISRFSELIKSLADRFTEFVNKLSADDIRTGFDTFSRFIDIAVNTFGKLIELMTWAINNAPKVGAILGAAFGAAAGAIAGPAGMAIGAAAGGAAGVYAGRQVAPSKEDLLRTQTQNQLAEFQNAQKAKERELLKFNELIPLLQEFKGLNNLKGLDNLFKAENLNTKTLTDLNNILKGKEFKTDASKAEAVRAYAKYGVALGPNDRKLSDVLGPPKAKKEPKDPLMGTLAQAGGLDRNFFTEWENLNKLYKAGRLNLDELANAQANLLSKQPVIEKYHKDQRLVIEAENKATEQLIESALREVKVKEDIQNSLDTNERLAALTTDELRVQTEYENILNQFMSNGITISKEKSGLILEQIQRTDRLREITAVENQIIANTVDKYKQQVLLAEAIRKIRANPNSGVTDTQITDYVVSNDPNMVGGQQYLDAQKRATEDYYAYINMLRSLDVINEETAWQARLNAQLQYDQLRLRGSSEFYGNLASLQKSSNSKLAAIGKAAAVAQATIDAYLAINKALATIPPPLSYAVATAIGAAAFANVQSIVSTKGFITGGYTGDGAATQISGVTHGQEFVMNRSATAKNRQTLEAMNRGQTIGGGGGVTVEIQNYGTSKNFVVDQMSPSQVRIIARDEAESVVAAKAPAIIAADMDNPNSRVSKSMARNLRTSRNRG